jgi:pilus assembly protein CpaF
MGTIHANSAHDAILKLQTLPLLAGANISHAFIVPTVASAIDLVVQVAMDQDGNRHVVEVLSITGRTESSHIETESVWEWKEGKYREGIGLANLRGKFALSHLSDPDSTVVKDA